ncbi:FkbB-type 16 kD peptidyl-prolyl cis-trans isomerase [Citrobacter amalonaticus]|nr:FkbB-type 16 kD peptidyl-prolyl cis-trans isomerase [Citrobacter amalonaticus]
MSKSVQSNSAVLVHFTLKLDDGSTAESTRNNGKPALFAWGMVLCLKDWSNIFSD